MSAGAAPSGGTLWAALERCTRGALASGALQPIATRQRIVDDGGVRFVVRVVSSLARKHAARRARDTAGLTVDPFLPYEQDLFVADISAAHVALLNKFSVIDHHLLIVTRAFEHQDTLLTPDDFRALFTCLVEFPGLGFYNGGAMAGASQAHKHLQIVPLPLCGARGPAVPIAPLLETAAACGPIPGLPLRHAFARLDGMSAADDQTAARAYECYRALLHGAGLRGVHMHGELRQSGAYNLLVTREWMLLVPRARECCESISVNALGFAGSLFVRDRRQLQTVIRLGPMAVLRSVAFSGTSD